MVDLPQVRPIEAIRALKRLGFYLRKSKGRKSKGAHRHFKKEGHPLIVTVPFHRKPLKLGTLRSVIESTGYTEEQFMAALRGDPIPPSPTRPAPTPAPGPSPSPGKV